ncbi:hypothetical protein ACN28S_16690 [Cystobacter fuscus]
MFTHPDGKPWATLEVTALPGAPKERRQATFTLHDEMDLLTMQPVARLADGRWVTKASFETGPILGAVAGLAVALAAYGLLRRHWRQEGLDAPAPELPLREARVFLGVASVNSTLFALHLGLAWSAGLSMPHFMPLVGGLLELGTLYLLCVAVLEAGGASGHSPASPGCGGGWLLMLLPPAIELGIQLHARRP